MVEHPANELEREESGPKTTRPPDRIRCIPQRVGSIMPRDTDRWSVVPAGETTAHKLPRATSGNTSSQNLSEGPKKQERSTAPRQSDSSSLCKQLGRYSLRPGHETSKRAVDVVPTEGHTSDSTTSTRERECDSRQRVENDEGSLRLDAQSGDLPPDPKALSLPRDRSVCNTTLPSTTPLLQLETRSPGRSNRCFSPGLGTSEGLCQPPHRESTNEGGVSRGGASNTNSPNMAVTALVSQATKPVSLPPTEDRSSTSGYNGGSSGSNSIPSRVAYLRQHYKDQKLSSEASDLLLSSWRQKTSQSYDSLSKKWISWCTERQCDPISGPIEDVVNFLAHLYKEGYQYRSLNAYRSAIASMHIPIEGVSIGQHPLVSRLLKGAFQSRPPLPRYQGTWDVSVVLHHIGGHQLDQSLSLKELSLRTVMLLALTRPSRSADISKLRIQKYSRGYCIYTSSPG